MNIMFHIGETVFQILSVLLCFHFILIYHYSIKASSNLTKDLTSNVKFD